MNINLEHSGGQYIVENVDERSFTKQALYKYLKYWPIILISVITALSLSYVVNSRTPAQYRVESKFLIKEEDNSMNLFGFNWREVGALGPKGNRLSNEAIILKSRPMVNRALDKLDFDVEYYKERKLSDKEIYKTTPVVVELDWNHPQLFKGQIEILWRNDESFKITFLDDEYKQYVPGEEKTKTVEKPILKGKEDNFLFGQWCELPYSRFRVRYTGSDRKGKIVVVFRDRESLLNEYTGDNLSISPVEKTSSILSLSLKTTQPQKGRDYLNTLMEVFLESELEEKNRTASNTIEFIDNQISGVSDSLGFIENKLEKFRSNNRTYNISKEGGEIFEQLAKLEETLAKEKFKRDYYQNLQEYLADESYHKIIVPSGLGIEDPILNTLIENLIELQSEKSRLLSTQSEGSPLVIEVSRKMDDLTASVKEVLKNVDKNANFLINDLQDRINKTDIKFSRLPETEQNLLRLERDFTINENIYTFLLQRRAESAISKASNTASNKIIEAAVPDFIPLALKPMLNYVLSLMLGLIFSFLIISLIISFDVTIKDSKELGQKLKIPLIAQIGQNKSKVPLIVMDKPRSGITEAFRSLRTNINFTLPKGKQLTLMLTSSISGEGKTFCAMNLACVYALSGKKTLLVGCDLRKPKLYNYFGISGERGLSNYLSGQNYEITQLIQSSKYANLNVLVEGPLPPNPAELLINDRFESMIEELKKKYDVIILDTPPIALVSETLDLTRSVDFTLYLIRYNYSDKSFINSINILKEKKGLKNIYAIFNDIDNKKLNYKGYGYGYFSEDKKRGSLIKKLFIRNHGRVAF